jgi:putative endonuclease
MTTRRQSLKTVGENAAASYLESLGYRILDRNFRTRGGEIDIVALDGETLCFVEVKTRSSRRFGSPAESVDERKMQTIAEMADEYLLQKGAHRGNSRFDIVEVLFVPGKPREVGLIKNIWALDPEGGHFC